MVIVSPHCGLDPAMASGGARYEVDLCTGLVASGDDLHILLARGKPVPSELEKHVERIQPARGLRWPVMLAVMPYWLSRCVRAHSPDLIRAHSLRFTGLPSLIAARRHDLPMVAHLHHLDPDPLNLLIERTVMRGATHVIADSQFAKRQAVALGVPDDRVSVVYCGVPDAYSPGPSGDVRSKYGLGESQIVLSVGPLIRRKRPLDTIWLFVRAGLSRSILVWIGDGPLRRQAQALVHDLGIADRVRLLGYVPDADKLNLYRTATVYLTLSRREGFALAPLEAMACGVPVIAPKGAASWAEMIEDGLSGVLCWPQELRGALEAMLLEPSWRDGLGSAAARRIDRYFRVRHLVEGVREVYKEAKK